MNEKGFSKAAISTESCHSGDSVSDLQSQASADCILHNLSNYYYKIFNGLDVGYFEVDLKGRYTYVNQIICEYYGKDAKALINAHSLANTPQKSRKKAIKVFKEIFQKDTPARITDLEFIKKDGSIVYVDLSAALIRDENGTPVAFRGIAIDRTLKILKERDLERYRDFVINIDDGCFETNLDGNLVFINPAMCEVHGYPYEELVGMDHRNFAAPDEAKKIFDVFNLIYRTGIPSRVFDYNITTKSGAVRNVEVSAQLIHDEEGKPIGFRGITRDRTQRKQREVELERYRAFVENVEDACFEVDLKGNFTFFNDAVCRIFGYSPEQIMGMNNREYTTAEMASKTYRIFNKIYTTGKSAEIYDYEIRRGDGQSRHLDMTISLMRDAKSHPIGFRGICRDVTEQKKSQEENERLNALLSEAQRLEATATLAAGVAHNFNNLLMSIQGYVSLLGMEIEPGHPNQKRIKTIEEHIKKGSDLTIQLLSYANVSYSPTHKANINEVIGSSLSVFKMTIKQVNIVERYADAVNEVAVDRKQMEHVFNNLFKNAIQAMPNGGSLYVETENVILNDAFVGAYERNSGPYVKITVKDTGVGMDKATKERIFEPFFTTQNLGAATGLGLAAVYGVIKKHLGIIEVESEKNKGTTFTVYLPAIEKASSAQASPQPAEVAATSRKAILIVDDEEIFIKLTAKMIGKLGHTILSASNGQIALETFRKNKDQIELVIMDMVMPGLSGDQLIEMLQGIKPEVNIILVSGYIKDEKMKKIVAQSRRAFLQKPFEREALIETIESFLETEKG